MDRLRICVFIITFCFAGSLRGQQFTIELGPDKIASNQAFTITLTAHNTRLSKYSGFPEIEGLSKGGTSSSSSTNFINGQRSSSQSITQNYFPVQEGSIYIPDFSITVNGQQVNAKGKTVTVGPPAQRRRRQYYDPFGADPFEDFFGQRNKQPQEFVDVKADAFLALTSDKPSVYVGEGFTMTLAFYVAQRNQAELRFYELNEQLTKIIKQIKPTNCWEENFEIENISGVPVEIGGKPYTQYKLFQAAYFPLNSESIELPKVGMEFIKYRVAKNPTFFGRNKQEDITSFFSKAKTVEVKELPDHPLKESVSVGNYRLNEKISKKQLQTGESFTYNFTIGGEGNISAISDLAYQSDENFDLYPPNIRQDVNRGNGRVRGKKSFSFYGVPNEPGVYDMSKYFQWIYFNPALAKYDTLKSEIFLTVAGESKKNESISSSDLGSFYDTMNLQDNTIFSLDEKERMRTILNIVIFALLGLAVVIIIKK